MDECGGTTGRRRDQSASGDLGVRLFREENFSETAEYGSYEWSPSASTDQQDGLDVGHVGDPRLLENHACDTGGSQDIRADQVVEFAACQGQRDDSATVDPDHDLRSRLFRELLPRNADRIPQLGCVDRGATRRMSVHPSLDGGIETAPGDRGIASCSDGLPCSVRRGYQDGYVECACAVVDHRYAGAGPRWSGLPAVLGYCREWFGHYTDLRGCVSNLCRRRSQCVCTVRGPRQRTGQHNTIGSSTGPRIHQPIGQGPDDGHCRFACRRSAGIRSEIRSDRFDQLFGRSWWRIRIGIDRCGNRRDRRAAHVDDHPP